MLISRYLLRDRDWILNGSIPEVLGNGCSSLIMAFDQSEVRTPRGEEVLDPPPLTGGRSGALTRPSDPPEPVVRAQSRPPQPAL